MLSAIRQVIHDIFTLTRLKTCKEERDRFETQLTASERSNTSLDAQRKSALADKNRLQKEVNLAPTSNCLLYKPNSNSNVQGSHIVHVCANVFSCRVNDDVHFVLV